MVFVDCLLWHPSVLTDRISFLAEEASVNTDKRIFSCCRNDGHFLQSAGNAFVGRCSDCFPLLEGVMFSKLTVQTYLLNIDMAAPFP